MIVHRRPKVRIVSVTPLCSDLKTRCYPLAWFACTVNDDDEPWHVIVLRAPDGRMEVLAPPPPINGEMPGWMHKHVTVKVKRHIRRMARGEA